jgi:hypothetical protein
LNGPSLARALTGDALRAGTLAGLAMMPFGAAFRAAGLRINEYGPKTLALVLGDLEPPLAGIAGFAQHLLISWLAAPPLILAARGLATRSQRALAGALYGAAFYVVVNSLALPVFFGDPTPWALGLRTVFPSLVVHLVYGIVVGVCMRATSRERAAR